MPRKKSSTPKRPSKGKETVGDVSGDEKVITEIPVGAHKSVATKKPMARKAAAKKATTKRSTTKKLAPNKAASDAVHAAMETSSSVVVASAASAAPTSGKNAMEEALRDLDRMMTEEDSVYRLGSQTRTERNCGIGMGETLKTPDEAIGHDFSENVGQADETMSSAGDQRLSVESILGSSDTFEDDDVGRAPSRLTTPRRRKSSKLLLSVPILVFVLALLLVAEGAGLFGGAGRRWTSEALSAVSSRFGQRSVQEVSQSPERPSFPSVVSVNVLVVAKGSDVETAVPGSVTSRMIETDVQLQDTFEATGEAFSDDARSVGVITVVNSTSRDFRFVAKTRFLSEDDVLFRLKEATDVPADGSVDVSVYADVAGSTGDIGPSRFTIPGLSQELEVTEPEVGTPGATFSLKVSAEFRTLVVPEVEIMGLLQARMEGSLLDG